MTVVEHIFQGLLAPSCAGALLAVLLRLLRPVTEKHASAAWHYRIWLAVLALMLLPLRLPSPAMAPPAPAAQEELQPEPAVLAAPGEPGEDIRLPREPGGRDWGKTLAFLWLGGAVCSLSVRLGRYGLFRKEIFRRSRPAACPDLADWGGEKLTVRRLSGLGSPLLLGVFRPVLFLPESPLTKRQMAHVLAHEVTHWKRRDLLFKWFVLLVKCVHWFNPLVYWMARQADLYGEISCDLAVTRSMSREERKEYIRTILALAAPGSPVLSAGLTGPYKTLSRRFAMIQHRKPRNHIQRLASALLAGALLVSGGAASAAAARAAAARALRQPEEIVAWNGDQKLEFENKPFAGEGTVYFPLRETLEQFGVMDHPDSGLTYRDGVVELTLAWDMEQGVALHHYRLAIGSHALVENSRPTATGMDLAYTVDMPAAPVLKDGVTYVPYPFLRALSVNQTFASFSFQTLDENGEAVFTLPPISLKNGR